MFLLNFFHSTGTDEQVPAINYNAMIYQEGQEIEYCWFLAVARNYKTMKKVPYVYLHKVAVYY